MASRRTCSIFTAKISTKAGLNAGQVGVPIHELPRRRLAGVHGYTY